MTVQEQVKKDMVEAMKSKESDKVSLLKVVMGEFNRSDKELSDEKAIKLIRSMLENAKQLNNQFEISVLEKYLPQMLDETKINEIVSKIVSDGGYSTMKDMGKVMGELKKHPNSTQIDNKIASKIVKQLLG